MMIMTPTKPMAIAVQRRQPTTSPRKIAPAAVVISGTIWLMAEMLAIGMWNSAKR